MHNVEVLNKNKSLSLSHLNTCYLNKNFDDLQHLLSCAKNSFDIMGVTKTRITKEVHLLNNLNLNNYLYEFTSTKLLHVALFFTFLTIHHINDVLT